MVRDAQQLGLVHLIRRQPAHAHHRRHGPIRQRRIDKVVPIEPFTLHGEEQLTRPHRARVNRVAGRLRRVGEIPLGMDPIGNLSQRQLQINLFPLQNS
jgi:hypothetical protein